MSFPPRWLRQRSLTIPRDEVSFERRRFACRDSRARERLERAAGAVLDGYHAALEAEEEVELAGAIRGVEADLRGFACEGAAMALTLLDRLSPWRASRWQAFLTGAGADHPYMLHVGAGLALARMRRKLQLPKEEFDPLLGWLVADGYGFHEGFFHAEEVARGGIPSRVVGYARRAFDQGVGRSLWFSCGADTEAIAGRIEAMPLERRPDLWSGVGLACAYAGGMERPGIEALRSRAERFAPELAQGAAFAAQARARARNPSPATDLACRALCRCDAASAAAETVRALDGLPPDGEVPSFEAWRRRIQARFAGRATE
ncbi:MAG: DUF1702 family protein [Planctomycetota bacterium]